MSWEHAVRLVDHENKIRSEHDGMDFEEAMSAVETLTRHVGNEYRVEVSAYDPGANP